MLTQGRTTCCWIRTSLAVLLTLLPLVTLCAGSDDIRFECEHVLSGFYTSAPLVSVSSSSQQQFPRTHQLGSCATLRLRGRIDTDSIWTTQSAANVATFGDLGDVVGLRRAWVGAEGDLGESGRYITEIDLASGEVVPRDVFVGLGEVDKSR